MSPSENKLALRSQLALALRSGAAFSALQQLIFWIVTLRFLQNVYYSSRYLTFNEVLQKTRAKLKRTVFNFLRTLSPQISQQISTQVEKSVKDIEKGMVKIAPGSKVYRELPKEGLSVDKVKSELERYKGNDDTEFLKGRVSGAVYHASGEILEVSRTAMTTFSSANVGFFTISAARNKRTADM